MDLGGAIALLVRGRAEGQRAHACAHIQEREQAGASHLVGSHRIASRRVASHRIASHRVSRRIASHPSLLAPLRRNSAKAVPASSLPPLMHECSQCVDLSRCPVVHSLSFAHHIILRVIYPCLFGVALLEAPTLPAPARAVYTSRFALSAVTE